MKNKITVFGLCCLLLQPLMLYAQEQTKTPGFYKNTLLFEFSGHSRNIFSLNYERAVYHYKDVFYMTLRTGIGRTPGYSSDGYNHGGYDSKGFWGVPLVLSGYYGKRHSRISAGIGYNASFGKAGTDSSTAPPTIYQSFESAIIFRAGYMYRFSENRAFAEIYPIYMLTDNPAKDQRQQFGFGIAFGISFN